MFMPHTRFVLISRWRLLCPAQDVWSLLTQVDGWPRWWPHVHSVRILERSEPGKAGTRAELTWQTALGYRLTIQVLNTRTQRHPDGSGEIEGQSEGDLRGIGLWLIEPVSPQGVCVTYRFQVELTRPWMRRFAPLLKTLFAWNHFRVMRSGAIGMGQHLHCPVLEIANWRAGPT